MNSAQKEVIDLLIDYINSEDWPSVKVVLTGQFLDTFDPIKNTAEVTE